jgi:hypothetical protein
LFAGGAEKVARKVVAAAKAGENWAAKLVVERLLPPAKDPPISFKLGKINSPLEIPARIQEVLRLSASGQISLSDAERICAVLNTLRAAFETADMAERLEAVEQRLEAAGIAPPGPNGKPYGGLHA